MGLFVPTCKYNKTNKQKKKFNHKVTQVTLLEMPKTKSKKQKSVKNASLFIQQCQTAPWVIMVEGFKHSL